MKTIGLRLIVAALIIAAMTVLSIAIFSNYWSDTDEPAAAMPTSSASIGGVYFLCPTTVEGRNEAKLCRRDLRSCKARLTDNLHTTRRLPQAESIEAMSLDKESEAETIWSVTARKPRTSEITRYRYRSCRGTLEPYDGA